MVYGLAEDILQIFPYHHSKDPEDILMRSLKLIVTLFF